MRNASRRSFTVEVKSDRRRPSTFIPTRVTAPDKPPRLKLELRLEMPAPAVEKRRILPNLIVPEVPAADLEPVPVAEERKPARPRGRPRKPRPASDEPVVEAVPAPVTAQQAIAEPSMPVRSAPSVRVRRAVPTSDLPRGERWKRRLGRWAR